jgi:hypothetical protein
MIQKTPSYEPLGTQTPGGQPRSVPIKTVYFGFRPSTPRYRQVFALAEARGCSWQDVIRDAIDKYLAQFPPNKI